MGLIEIGENARIRSGTVIYGGVTIGKNLQTGHNVVIREENEIGDDFAIVTNPFELFCGIGIQIKDGSPFKNTMVTTLTNGARGYVPTREAFDGKGYETWFGEHSFLSKRTGEVTEKVLLDLLEQLQSEE